MRRRRRPIKLPLATFTCDVCGEVFTQRLDESFLDFSSTVYDTHTEMHIERGEMPMAMRVAEKNLAQELAAILRETPDAPREEGQDD